MTTMNAVPGKNRSRALLRAWGAVLVAAAFGVAPATADTAAPLTLNVKDAPAGTALQALIEPGSAAWGAVEAAPIHLNRTPPLYSGGPFDDGVRPTATVQILRLGDAAVVRAHWNDPNANMGPGTARRPDVGAAAIYKQHSEDVATFADAFCVMVPSRRGAHDTYPSMIMGDKGQPTELYYWRADKGFQELTARGRTSTQATGKVPQGAVVREADGWTVTMTIPDLEASTPIAFAVWDGANDHRDGLKWFSLWYEVR